MRDQAGSSPRVLALVGPHRSGKTSLLESLLLAASAIPKKGRVRDGTRVSDASPEARARGMSVEVTPVTATYHGDEWTFLDCPGSVEFAASTNAALEVADVAVVVAEPDPDRAVVLAPILRRLDAASIPHVIFVNKVDGSAEAARLTECFEAMRAVSARPLVMRELPMVDGERISGIVDLVSEQGFVHEGAHDVERALRGAIEAEAHAAHAKLVERVADFDDPILETLLDDREPTTGEVVASLGRDLRDDRLVSVFFGSAELDVGVERLLESLRHEAPRVDETSRRLGLDRSTGPVVRIWKTVHAQHVGKQSYGRVFRAELAEGDTLDGTPVNGIQRVVLGRLERCARAVPGEIVTIARLDAFQTGETVAKEGRLAVPFVPVDEPVHTIALASQKSGDDAKLGLALQKLVEEDPSLRYEVSPGTDERLLRGAGEVHLDVTLARLANRFGLTPTVSVPENRYRESIRRSIEQRGRYKHQTGGHGQFGDVLLRIEPLPRGEGFRFREEVVGGAIPRSYFGAIEAAAEEALARGPLGFPVVDVAVTLLSGSYHSVDSSDQAFKSATRLAMHDGLARGEPVLLEPIDELRLVAPREFLAKVQRVITARRGGQILGYDEKEGFPGWDEVVAHLPHAETQGLIVELRSSTLGLGTFVARHHHDREVLGREAEKIVEARRRMSA